MSLFHYQVSQDPDTVTVKAEVTDVSAGEAKAKVTEIQPFSVTLHSSDSGITRTVANIVALFISLFKNKPYELVKDNVVGKEQQFPFGQPIGYALTVHGDTISVTATSLAIETHQGMLMAHGTVEIG